MDIKPALKNYVLKSIVKGGTSRLNPGLLGAIDHQVWEEFQKSKYRRNLPTPTDFKTWVAYEVNKAKPQLPAAGNITTVPRTGTVVIRSVKPLLGLIGDQTISLTSRYPVTVGSTHTYDTVNGEYRLRSAFNGYIKIGNGFEHKPGGFAERLDNTIRSVEPSMDPEAFEASIRDWHTFTEDGIMCALSGESIARIESGLFKLYTNSEVVVSVNIAQYLSPVGSEVRWVAKLLQFYDKVILIIGKHKIVPVPEGCPEAFTRSLGQRWVPVPHAFELLILSLDGAIVDYRPVAYSSLEYQTSFAGYVDAMVDAVSGELLLLYQSPIAVTTTLTVDTYKYVSEAGSTHTTWASYVAYLRAREEDTSIPQALRNRDYVTVLAAGSRSYELGGLPCKLLAGLEEKELSSFNNPLVTSFKGQAVVGGMTSAYMAQDYDTGEVYVGRGFEAYAVAAAGITPTKFMVYQGIPGFAVDELKPHKDSLVGFGGYRYYDAAGNLLAEHAGEDIAVISHLVGDVWSPQFPWTSTDFYLFKRYIADIDDEQARQSSIAYVFYNTGPTNFEFVEIPNWESFGDTVFVNLGNVGHIFPSVGLELQKRKLAVLRDRTLNKSYLVVYGECRQLLSTAESAWQWTKSEDAYAGIGIIDTSSGGIALPFPWTTYEHSTTHVINPGVPPPPQDYSDFYSCTIRTCLGADLCSVAANMLYTPIHGQAVQRRVYLESTPLPDSYLTLHDIWEGLYNKEVIMLDNGDISSYLYLPNLNNLGPFQKIAVFKLG